MHYLEIIEVAANYLSYLNFDLFSRMSTTRDPKTFCLRVLFFSEAQVL